MTCAPPSSACNTTSIASRSSPDECVTVAPFSLRRHTGASFPPASTPSLFSITAGTVTTAGALFLPSVRFTISETTLSHAPCKSIVQPLRGLSSSSNVCRTPVTGYVTHIPQVSTTAKLAFTIPTSIRHMSRMISLTRYSTCSRLLYRGGICRRRNRPRCRVNRVAFEV